MTLSEDELVIDNSGSSETTTFHYALKWNGDAFTGSTAVRGEPFTVSGTLAGDRLVFDTQGAKCIRRFDLLRIE